jgi:hypothetical protein
VHLFDVDTIVFSSHHYQATINGQACRFDGIHFSVYCASPLRPTVLG